MTSSPGLGRWTKRALRAPARLYDVRLGWLLGHRFCRLTHRGRRSGRLYRTVLEVVDRDPRSGELVVMAGLGHRADWFRNVLASPPVELAVATTRFRPAVRVLPAEEAARCLGRYEHRHRWASPLLRVALGKLVGWSYDGSAAARLRLVGQCPLVGFRPLNAGSEGRSAP